MESYIACLCCECSLSPESALLKVIQADKVIAGLCSTCLTSVRTFKMVLTQDRKGSTYAPLQFQCLEEFTVPRNADIEP